MIIKKYIRGVTGRCNEVIAELEKLGGINEFLGTNYTNSENKLYFIQKDNVINYCELYSNIYNVIIECFEEIKLPEPEKKYPCYVTIFDGKDCNICKTANLGVERIKQCKGCNSFKCKITLT